MKIIRSEDLKFEPASHEDKSSPGCLKKVLVTKDELSPGRLQMINWALLPKSKSFSSHYHQDMQEVFVILNGEVEIEIDDESARLKAGDAVLIPEQAVHRMSNVSSEDVYYIALGVSRESGGKTIVVGS